MSDEMFIRYKRKTISVGPRVGDVAASVPKRDREFLDEVYIREMNIAAGGVGCAAWDASIMLARFIHRMRAHFAGRRVHEVGAGVGLPGLVAARYAASALISDYVPTLVDNIAYNIKINATRNGPTADDEAVAAARAAACAAAAAVEDDCSVQTAAAAALPAVPEALAGPEATDGVDAYREQMRARMTAAAVPLMLDWEEYPKMSSEQQASLATDIILGSEVTYSQIQNSALPALFALVDATLTKSGVFYTIQSVNRETHEFVTSRMIARGFEVYVRMVPKEECAECSTGQIKENYAYYTFRRPGSQYPVMGEEIGAMDLTPEEHMRLRGEAPKLDRSLVTIALVE